MKKLNNVIGECIMKNSYYNNYYRNVSGDYNDIRLDTQNDRENVIEIIKKHVNIFPAKILDIGCGTGKYGQMLLDCGYQVIGVDKSLEQVEQAKELIEAYQEDAQRLSFPDCSFDACIMIIMLQQLSQEERNCAFLEAYRVLKPKGVLIIKTCSHDDLKYRSTAEFFPRTFIIDCKRYPDIPQLKEELSMFSDIQVEKSFISVEKDKDKMLKRYMKRGTSNLSFLSDRELEEGILKFKEKYHNQEIIKRVVRNTFVIARKD